MIIELIKSTSPENRKKKPQGIRKKINWAEINNCIKSGTKTIPRAIKH